MVAGRVGAGKSRCAAPPHAPGLLHGAPAAALGCSPALLISVLSKPVHRCHFIIILSFHRPVISVLSKPVHPFPASLLTALLGGGELPLLSGRAAQRARRLSVAPQSPWLTGGSVRHNVLLGAPLQPQLYEAVRKGGGFFVTVVREGDEPKPEGTVGEGGG